MSKLKDKIWLFESYSDKNDFELIKKVLKRPQGWSDGPEVLEFENKFADFIGRKYAVSFNSGTSALYSNLLAHGITSGEVIVPSFTFVATANSVVAAGAKPVFADINTESLALDSKDVMSKITKNTKAIMPIHFAGDICKDIIELRRIADKNNIFLIEDAAHAIGVKFNNKNAGTFGDSACFSFCFNKVITTGEGGMVVTDSEELTKKLKLLRSHGRDKDNGYISFGFNFRLPTICAALGLSQMEKVNSIIKKRREMALYLNDKLSGIKELILPIPRENCFNVYQLYNLRFKEDELQKGLKDFLQEQGVPTRISYPPVHLTPYYRNNWGSKKGDLPVTEEVANRILSLPFHLNLSKKQLDYIIKVIKGYFNK